MSKITDRFFEKATLQENGVYVLDRFAQAPDFPEKWDTICKSLNKAGYKTKNGGFYIFLLAIPKEKKWSDIKIY